MLLVDGEKMSKSLGNFFTSAELTEVLTAAMEKAAADYEACMDDDFNTAGAVAAYFQLVDEAAEKILEARAAARAAKDWATADAIRDQLRDMGLAIEDTAAGCRIKPLNGDRL